MARRESLGAPGSVLLPGGATVDYHERGHGRPVVFVHGLLVNADLWRHVVPGVAEAGYRCIAPDWPLGAHGTALPDTVDVSPPGVAHLIADFLTALDLREVTLVANDTGGALVQILMASGLSRDRLARVVLTPSDSFERFLPSVFSYLPRAVRVPGFTWLLTQAARPRMLHRLPLTFGWLTKRPIPTEVIDSYLRPSRTSPHIRRDLTRFLRGVHRRHTLAAARQLHGFGGPVLLPWAVEDRLFPLSLAHRLADVLPDARVVAVPDSYTFIPEDQPAQLSRLIVDFLTPTTGPNRRDASSGDEPTGR
jgi:pimeloyl-ACP methyl ester carboxylesterase